MQIMSIVIEFTLIYVAIILSLVLISLIEINDTTKFIKKQFRELLTKELLKHLEEAAKLEKQREQLDQPNN